MRFSAEELKAGQLYLLKDIYAIIDRLSNKTVSNRQLFMPVNVDLNSQFLKKKCWPGECTKQHCLLMEINDRNSFIMLCSDDYSWEREVFEKIS